MKNTILIAIMFLSIPNSYAQRHSFQWIGDLPGGAIQTKVFAVSHDGRVIAGASWHSTGNAAIRWENGQMISLGDLDPFLDDSVAYGINSDGSIITGTSRLGNSREAFVWQNVIEGIGFLSPGSVAYSFGNDVSEIGTVVGQSVDGGGYHAFIWDRDIGMSPLPRFNGPVSIATAITNDGVYIVGGASIGTTTYYAVRWINKTGPYQIGPSIDSIAYGVSESGNEIAGHAIFSGVTPEAFLWTESTGMVGLGFLPDSEYSSAYGISGDGTRVVGRGNSNENPQAFIWDDEHGMLNIKQILEDNCVDMSDVDRLSEARGISGDGRIIVGSGRDIDGHILGFRVNIPLHDNYADINDDDEVDINDLSLLLSSFGRYAIDEEFNRSCDLDCDGNIGITDLSLLFGMYGI